MYFVILKIHNSMNIANSFIEEQIQKRMVLDNPWWESGKVDDDFTQFPRRAYLDDFMSW